MSHRSRVALIGAGASSAALVLLWLLALHTHLGTTADQSAFLGFAQLQRPRVNSFANAVAHLCDPGPFLILSTVAVALAFARGRARLAITVAVILLGASATTQVLKPLLAQPRAHWMIPWHIPVSPASWPSGHATAALSLALALVLAAPARWRPFVAALGAGFAVAVCYSFLTLGWHFPSDVVGGYLVAVTWTQLALAGLFALDARRAGKQLPGEEHAPSLRAALTPPAVAVVAAAALAALVAVVRPHAVISLFQVHKTFLVSATAIGALALALATAVMLGLRTSAPATPGSRPAT